MNNAARDGNLAKIRGRYRLAGRKYKKLILDEFCKTWGCHRKHAIRLLRANETDESQHRGARPKYSAEVIHVLEDIWHATNRVCSKLLKAALPAWMPYYRKTHGVSTDIVEKVLSVSPATIDRLLKPTRKIYGSRGRCGTRPGTWLKHQIPIKTDHSDVDRPGYVQVDTVAHCGQSLDGDFVWTLNLTDVFSGWTESRAVWNKGYDGVFKAIKEIEDELPFPIIGFHSDNGGEFINQHLHRYISSHQPSIAFTRSRPSHKNDNPHVEQKNWSRVRQLLGYQRIEDIALIPTINLLYRGNSLLANFFTPTLKLEKKSKIGSRYVRTYERLPKTPYQRLMDSPHLFEIQKTHATEVFCNINPFSLKKLVDSRQKAILNALR